VAFIFPASSISSGLSSIVVLQVMVPVAVTVSTHAAAAAWLGKSALRTPAATASRALSWAMGHGRRQPSRNAEGGYFTTPAPTFATTSSCEPVPPEQPMAPMSFPFSTSGIPPREAMTPSTVTR
jgi:hypothetical protein